MSDPSPRPGRRPRRGGRALRPALALAVTAAGLSACSTGWGSGPTYPDATDVERASAVWRDPWVAPTDALTAGPTPAPDAVTRTVGRRTSAYGAPPATDAGDTTGADADLWAVGLEVADARAAGWRLHGLDCGLGTAYLVHGDVDDLDTLRVAVVADAEDGVEVTAYVPHHRDGSWPDPGPEVDPAATCLAGGTEDAGQVPDDLASGAPLDGDGAVGDGDRSVPRWPDTDPEREDLDARIAEAEGDAWVTTLTGDVSRPREVEDDWRRDAPVLRERVAVEGATPAARVADAVATVLATSADDAWGLTWVTCAPGDGARPAAATLRRTGGTGTAVLRLTADADDTSVAATVTLPPEGWTAGAAHVDEIDDLPALDPDEVVACGAGAGPAVATGTPAVLPSSVWPSED